MRNRTIAPIATIALGALTAIAPQTFAHACQGHGTPGACHYSQQAATGIGLAILALGVAALFASPAIRIGLGIATIADAILLAAAPTLLVGVCKGAMMHCRMVMRPTIIVLAALAAATAAASIAADARRLRATAGR